MEQNLIPKKEGVKAVRKRTRELLKPLGFQSYPHSGTRLVRIREDFIDEVRFDTAGYHLGLFYFIYFRPAPFARLTCDAGRLYRTADGDISTGLCWECKFSQEMEAYYEPEHFEAVWQDVSFVLKQYILPQMEEMTAEKFLSRLWKGSADAQEFFRASNVILLTTPYFNCMGEAASYGVGMWRLGQYEEGLACLRFAREKFREWLAGHEQETEHFYGCRRMTLALLEELLSLWENKPEGWTAAIQERIDGVAADWTAYMP